MKRLITSSISRVSYGQGDSPADKQDLQKIQEACKYVKRWDAQYEGDLFGRLEDSEGWSGYNINITIYEKGDGSISVYKYTVDENDDAHVVRGYQSDGYYHYDSLDDLQGVIPDEALEILREQAKAIQKKYEEKLRQVKKSKSAKGQSGTYIIYICNNETAANRGYNGDEDTFSITSHRCDSEYSAMLLALALTMGTDDVQKFLDEYVEPDERENFDAAGALQMQDSGFGSPFCYGIRKGQNGPLIFDYSFDEVEELRLELEEEEEED